MDALTRSLMMTAGGGGLVILHDLTVTGYSESRFILTPAGLARSYAGSTVTNYEWLLRGAASDYEVYFAVVNGTVSIGSDAIGTWLPFSNSRQIIRINSGEVVVEVSIRHAISQAVLARCLVTLRNTVPPLTVKLSATNVTGSGIQETVTGDIAPLVTASGGGGSSPGDYTYLWSKVSGGAIDVTHPTEDATLFKGYSMTPGETRQATFRCRVSIGTAIVNSANVTVSLTRTP